MNLQDRNGTVHALTFMGDDTVVRQKVGNDAAYIMGYRLERQKSFW